MDNNLHPLIHHQPRSTTQPRYPYSTTLLRHAQTLQRVHSEHSAMRQALLIVATFGHSRAEQGVEEFMLGLGIHIHL